MNSHAHYDHAGGLAELKKVTGAKFVASEPDAPLLRSGGHGDFRFGDTLTFPPIEPDQIVHDGESIQLGNQRMIAHLTPGHTKGCTTWTTKIRDGKKIYDASSQAVRAYSITNSSARKVTRVSHPTSKGLSRY